MTRKVESITLRKPGELTWYICGPTVYDHAHIGHARAYICFDLMRRIIEYFFADTRIRILMGITDIDDKIILRARSEKKSPAELAQRYERGFIQNLRSLNIKLPESFMRVSDSIPSITQFIERLYQKKIAYEKENGVYFSVNQHRSNGFKYPRLRQNNIDESAVNGKENSRDFALWKRAKAGEPCWDSPWGAGRPGWHIECSAMSTRIRNNSSKDPLVQKYFPEGLDLHSGGIDLEFPHHENEIAQCEAYREETGWCSTFSHIGHLYLRKQKMSKSLGNTLTITDLLGQYKASEFRMLCLTVPYRQNLEFSPEKLEAAAAVLSKLEDSLENATKQLATSGFAADPLSDHSRLLLQELDEAQSQAQSALLDDFDWPTASQLMFVDFVRKFSAYIRGENIHSLVLEQTVFELKRWLQTFGLVAVTTEGVQSRIASSGIIDEAIAFRSKIRKMALESLKLNSAPLEKELLRMCDQHRDTLRNHGVEIFDKGPDSAWQWSKD